MLTALSPTAALRADLERGHWGVDVAAPGAAERGDDYAAWTLVASVLGRLDALPDDERASYAGRAGRALASRATAPGTGTPARPATAALARALRRWGRGSASAPEIVAAARDVVEDMERAGALALARTSLVALLRTASAAGSAVHGGALAHLGRVVRQSGELDEAIRLYDASSALAAAGGDGELVARAEVGRGVTHWQRGNFPAAREAYQRALAFAPARTPSAAGAHHGLMLIAIGAGDLATALLHGWRAFADAAHEADRRAEALINLGGLCRRLGEHEAALRAFQASLALTRTLRLRLNAIHSAALAAGHLGREESVFEFAREADEAMELFAQPYECGLALFDLGEAFAAAGNQEVAAVKFEACRDLAERHRFHELAWRAGSALETLAADAADAREAAAPAPRVAAHGAGAREVVDQVSRLPLAAAELLAVR